MGSVTKPYTFSNSPPGTNVIDAAQVNSDFDAIYGEFNGNIDNANIKSGAAIAASKIAAGYPASNLANGLVFFKGISIVGSDSRTNSAYGLMASPDRIQNVPINGAGDLLLIFYSARWVWNGSGSSGGNRAAIFVGSTQLQGAYYDSSDATVKRDVIAAGHGGAGRELPLVSANTGLTSLWGSAADYPGSAGVQAVAVAYPGSVGGNFFGNTLMQFDMGVSAGVCVCNVSTPGTYDVSVQFKTDGTGTISRDNAGMWVGVLKSS